jgi:hypothetical protein
MITSLVIMFGYLAFVVAKFGIPKSISETYYLLGKMGWLFQVTLFSVAFLVVPTLIDRSGEGTRFLAFLSCMGLAFVGAAPLFKRKLDGKVHYISAAMCCGGLVLWQVFNACWVVPLICFLAVFPPMLFDGKRMWWLEIATIVSAYVSLIWFS